MTKLQLVTATAVGVVLAAASWGILPIGVDDEQISLVGPPGDASFDALSPALAVDPTTGDQMICWQSTGVGENEYEIYCELRAADGTRRVDEFDASEFGPGGPEASLYQALSPSVTFNAVRSEFLVCWSGDTTADGQVDGEYEVFCRRFDDAAVPLGDAFRVSEQGGLGDAAVWAFRQDVAHDPVADRYLACWAGESIDPPQSVDGEFEVWCRFVGGDGAVDGDAFVVSAMGPPGSSAWGASGPRVVRGGTPPEAPDEFVVCWPGDHDADGQANDENEIFCRRVTADGGALPGPQTRMSFQGPAGDAEFDAARPVVSFDAERFRYLVCWDGDTDEGDRVNDEFEISCGEWHLDLAVATPARRVTFVGTDGVATQDAVAPTAASNGAAGWALCWQDWTASEAEIACRLLAPGLGLFGPAGATLSSMGSGGGTGTATSPALVRLPSVDEWLVVWSGGSVDHGQASGESEIFGQRVDPFAIFADGFESEDSGEWSAVTP